jgi:predicted ATPase/DNA-binding winged helix-turn-helix (wHTH) protein
MDPDTQPQTLVSFGRFRVSRLRREVLADGRSIRIGGRAFDLLMALIEARGSVVSKDVLKERVWPDRIVDENNLQRQITALRASLGADRDLIRTIPGRGYQFTGEVRIAPANTDERRSGTIGGRQRDALDITKAADAAGSADTSFVAKANLPVRGHTIIGRSDNIAAIVRELSQARLITVVGPAGIGKTTVAIATAENLCAEFDNAVSFVDLAPIEDSSRIVSALVSALGVVTRTDDPIAEVVDFLQGQRRLIVLDNCEQVIAAVATLADRIYRGAGDAHLLITSRETLRIDGERIHRLTPLECPPKKANISTAEAMGYAAVQLFVDRATASVSDFSLDDTLAPAAVEICHRLDGIPLAIELAAARVEFLGVPALARALNDSFAVLTQGKRLALARHQTMRATLDWGYSLLSPTEQAVLRFVAIFRAAFTLESALAVAEGPDVPFADAVDALANLVTKSLLTADRTRDPVQYRLLEVTRGYAMEKLVASGEESQTARRHAQHLLMLAESMQGVRQSERNRQWLERYAGRIDDIRAALDWSFSPNGDPSIGLDLIASSAQLWFQLSLRMEYCERIEWALQLWSESVELDPIKEMRLQIALGHALWNSMTKPDSMERAFKRALDLADGVDHAPTILRLQALWGLWAARRARGQYREALYAANRYQAVAGAAGDQAFILLGDRILGLTHHFLGNQQVARKLLEEVRRVARGTESVPSTDFQLGPEVAAATLLTRILWLQGLPDQAATILQEAIDAALQEDNRYALYYVLTMAGCPLALWIGDLARAQSYLDMLADHSAQDRVKDCWALILRLRLGGERNALIASFLEPRLDLSTVSQTLAYGSKPTIAVPTPDDDVGGALWSLPEILRVNAELDIWHRAPNAVVVAEERLHRSLELTRQQSTLSWELRTATSLARLWRRNGRAEEARDLLDVTCDKFSEGFGTGDFIVARQLIAEWT